MWGALLSLWPHGSPDNLWTIDSMWAPARLEKLSGLVWGFLLKGGSLWQVVITSL